MVNEIRYKWIKKENDKFFKKIITREEKSKISKSNKKYIAKHTNSKSKNK